MAEIIRRGVLPEHKWYQTTCGNCSTHFKFQRHEARDSGDQRDPGYRVKCPLCAKDVWMSTLNAHSSSTSHHGSQWDR